MKSKRSMSRWSNYSPSSYRKLKKNEHALLRENRNNIERSDWKFWRVVEKFEVGIEKVNYDAVETSSKNLGESKTFDAIDVGVYKEKDQPRSTDEWTVQCIPRSVTLFSFMLTPVS